MLTTYRLSTIKLRSIIIYCLAMILISCAKTPEHIANLAPEAQQEQLAQFKHWQIKGRFGFKSKDKKDSASFSWQQKQHQYKLNLTSIIGTSILKMVGNKQTVTLEVDDKIHQDTDASYLLWRMTGWQIPVEHFPIWVKGQHTQDAKAVVNEHGWVTQLQPKCQGCENWLINYDQYKQVGKLWLPHKIVLNNNATNSQLIIRVNSWS